MQPVEFSMVAGLALGSSGLFYGAWTVARRSRRRQAAKPDAPAEAPGSDPLTWRLERRMEAIELGQAEFAERLAGLAAGDGESGEARLQAMASSLVGLIKDKNATLETALAGLDQLRDRLKALEQMGDLAEARALFERLGVRLDEVHAAQAAAQAATEARLAAVGSETAAPFAALSERLAGLHAQKDDAVASLLARLAPLETRLAGVETGLGTLEPARAGLERLGTRLEELQRAQAAIEARLASQADAGPFAEISGQLTRLYGQKDAAVEAVFARLAPLEARLAELDGTIGRLDPKAALDGFALRLEALQARLAELATPAENPFAEISDQLTRLYAQKDATVTTVFARLAPLEARLAELEAGQAGLDPKAVLDGFADRLEALQTRLSDLEVPGENPFTEISDQLTRLYAQKDATVATMLARLAPLEARLAELQAAQAGLDPKAALDGLTARLAALEAPAENPYATISDQLTRLYAQKDATVEAVFARLAPLEAKLTELDGTLGRLDPKAALDRFAERLDAAQAAQAAAEARLQEEIAELRNPGENPYAAISEQLTKLYAQKDATVTTVLARLAPLEARLAELQAAQAGLDPKAALDGLAVRLEAAQEALQQQIDALREGENPYATISEQLTRLYAQKDATVEVVFARLAPLEAKLAELQATQAGLDPRAALDRFAERLEAAQAAQAAAEARLQQEIAELRNPGENPYAAISDQLTRLYAQKDATVTTVLARLAPLEARLAELQAAQAGLDPKAALEGLATRLEAVQARLADLEAADPAAGIAEQLAQLEAEKAAAEAALAARLAPLETQLAGLDGRFGRLDPKPALDSLGSRLTAVQARLADLEEVDPAAGIAEQLKRLEAAREGAETALLARLAPFEAQLAAMSDGIAGTLPRLAALEAEEAGHAGLAARIAALQDGQEAAAARLAALQAATETATESAALAAAEAPRLAALAGQLARLHAEKDAAVAAVLARLGPLEAQLAELAARPQDTGEDEARATAEAIAAQMIELRAAAAQTELFAERLAMLEASLPRLTATQSLMMRALERQSGPVALPEEAMPAGPAAEPAGDKPADPEAAWQMPRLVSLQK